LTTVLAISLLLKEYEKEDNFLSQLYISQLFFLYFIHLLSFFLSLCTSFCLCLSVCLSLSLSLSNTRANTHTLSSVLNKEKFLNLYPTVFHTDLVLIVIKCLKKTKSFSKPNFHWLWICVWDSCCCEVSFYPPLHHYPEDH